MLALPTLETQVLRRFERPAGQHEEQPFRFGAGDDGKQHLDGVGVSPLQVVDHHEQRAVGQAFVDQLTHPLSSQRHGQRTAARRRVDLDPELLNRREGSRGRER